MKKLLLTSVAVSGLAFAAAPAHAEINLELGGYFAGYGAFVDQDETTGSANEVNDFDILRDTQLFVGGETALDNGLTVGFQLELDVDGIDGSETYESYAYFSGDWGRVNFGAEDGAAYLLQVAAPSADSNVDGLRQFIQPFAQTGGIDSVVTTGGLDYDHATSAPKTDKLTYLSPIFSGFQLGASYTPDNGDANDLAGVGQEGNTLNETYEIGVRYEGMVQNVGVIVGAGYSHGENNNTATTADDQKIWNVGLDLDIGPFGIGAAYVEDSTLVDNMDIETFVLGADYTTGPFKIGVSYLNREDEGASEYDRFTGGVVYEYGPGMTFRGSIQHTEVDTTGTDADGTALILGTVVDF